MRYKNKIQQILKLSLDNLSEGSLKAVSGAFLIQILGIGTAYIFMIVLTRYYGLEAFGLYSLGFAVMNMGSILTRLGIDSSAVKFIPSFSLDKKKINAFYLKGISLVFVLSSIISLILYFSAGFLSEAVFKKIDLEVYIQSFAISLIFFSLIEFNAQTLRALGKTNWQVALKNLLTALIGLIIISFALLSNFDIQIYNLYLTIVSIICLLSFGILGKELAISRNDKKFIQETPIYRDIFKISIPMFLFGSMLLMSEWINTIMLGTLGTTEDVAVYRVIVRISALNVIVLTAFNTVLAPKIAGFFSNNRLDKIEYEIIKATKMIFWLSLPIYIILFVSGSWVLGIFGKEFIVGTSAFYLLLIGQLVNSMTGPVALILNMTDGQKFLSRLSFFKFIIIVILNFLLIPQWGLLGSAFATLTAKVLVNLINLIKVKRKFGFYVFFTSKLHNIN